MKLYLTGGGTGGHVTPGIAIARYFEHRHPGAQIRFAGSTHGIENKLVPHEGYPLDTIAILGMSRSYTLGGLTHNLKAAYLAATALGKAKALLRKAQPDCVVGCGGYASFPVVRAAQQMGIPTVLLEVNALPGKVTKALAPKASRVLVGFPETVRALGGGKNIVYTGAPVRGDLVHADRAQARKRLGLSEDQPFVVSFWGSTGAKFMNERMAGVFALACQNKVGWRHVHAMGAAASEWMPRMVREQGGNLDEHPNLTLTEYIYDMADHMAAADLLVCRAGAATLGELCMLGRPSILVPSPYVAENHQEKNARAIEAVGGCHVLLEKQATAAALYQSIEQLLSDTERLRTMGRAATALACTDASEQIDRQIMQAIAERGA